MESVKVAQFMTKRPVTFKPEMPVAKAVEKLLKSKQTGGPVIDEQGKLVGFISEQDCIRLMLETIYHCEDIGIVRDVMRTDVLAVTPDHSILELAQQMMREKPKLYPVIEYDRVVGVISRRDVLKAISSQLGACFHESHVA